MNPWSVFWRQGHSTTFGDYFEQGYDGAVADWWQTHVDALNDDGTVLEIGCGNCSLLPALVRSGKKVRYVGVDLAEVEISKVADDGLADSDVDVAVHAETPAEDLPEADASVDLAASVFGIEYSNLDESLGEVQRILKPGGSFVALLHHDASVVTSMSRRALSEYETQDVESVLAALATISAARDVTPSLTDLKNNADAERGRAEINRLAARYLGDTNLDTANATMFEFMSNALKFFKMMGASTAERQSFIESLGTEHSASRERFEQMVSVALDEGGIEQLRVKLTGLGFAEIHVSVIQSNNDILAWELCANKPLPH